MQLFPNLHKVVFLDDDVVIQRDLSPLWDIDLNGKVNGAVQTCKGEDEWVMSKRFRNYFNFSHPLIAKSLNPDECAWAYGMNIFDLHTWRKTNIRDTYHSWLKEVVGVRMVHDFYRNFKFYMFLHIWDYFSIMQDFWDSSMLLANVWILSNVWLIKPFFLQCSSRLHKHVLVHPSLFGLGAIKFTIVLFFLTSEVLWLWSLKLYFFCFILLIFCCLHYWKYKPHESRTCNL